MEAIYYVFVYMYNVYCVYAFVCAFVCVYVYTIMPQITAGLI